MNGVRSEEGFWTEPATHRQLFYRVWMPHQPTAHLVLVHGFGEHGGRYQSFASSLVQRGIAVLVPDLWGHGRSDGQRGDIADVRQCAADLARLVDDIAFRQPGQAYALFGHSFGGLLVLAWALIEPQPLRSVVTQSPLLEAGFPIPFWKRTAASLLARTWPRFSLRMNLDVTKLSHNPAVIQAYRADPLVHNNMTARSYRSLLHTRDEVVARAAEFHPPLALLCGAEDQIISVPMAQRWYEHLACEKRLVMFPGCYHELHHEPVRAQVIELVCQWTMQ